MIDRRDAPDAPGTRASSKRDHLVRVATELFWRDGFHATGIDKILREAGVAKMTLYKHFATKENLIVACLERLAAESHAELDAHPASVEGDGRTRLLAAFEWYADWADGKDFRGCPFHHALAEFSEEQHPAHHVACSHKGSMRARLGELAGTAALADPVAAAEELLLVLEGVLAVGASRSLPDLRTSALRLARRVIDAG